MTNITTPNMKQVLLASSELNELANRCIEMCNKENWKRNWTEGGCYLHLEVSELIESFRGKKGTPVSEAADVLFVLLSVLKHHNVDITEVLLELDAQLLKSENEH